VVPEVWEEMICTCRLWMGSNHMLRHANGSVIFKIPIEGEEDNFLVQLSDSIQDAQEAAEAIKANR